MNEALRDRLSTHPSALEEWEQRLNRLFAETFRPRTRMSVSEWAAQRRILSEGVSPEPGPWRHERTPYLAEVMDTISDPDVRKVVIVKSARVGYTEGVIGNGIGWIIDQDPGPIAVYQPTDSDADDWSKKQLAPMIRDTPCLEERLPEGRLRDGKNNIKDKIFPNGSLAIRGGFSPRVYRRINAKYVFFDEVSALVQNAGGEGDPIALGSKRAGNYPDRMIVLGSTPLVKGLCRITKEFEHSDQRYWHVPCPHCGHEQTLRWGGPDTAYGLKWDKDVTCRNCARALEPGDEACPACGSHEREVTHHPETAYYLCEGCGAAIEEHDKPTMVQRGRWIPKNPGHPTPGFFVGPALISLITADAEWSNLVSEWLKAQDDPEQLQAFFNQVLGEAWEERGKKFEPGGLAGRTEEWRDRNGQLVDVPDGVGVITAGIDVQEAGWLELLVRGWGAREESWLIAHHRIYGSVYAPDTWARLEPLLVKPYLCASGAQLRIEAVAVDSGDATDVAYAFVLPRQGRKVFAVKGKGGAGQPAVSRAKTAGRDGVQLFMVGVDTLKDMLFHRLKLATPGSPGYMHFASPRPEKFNGADAEYFAQLGAEKKLFNRKKRRWEYAKVRERNEAIDLEVYAMAALHILGAGVRELLGDRARRIQAAGPNHKEGWAAATAARRRGPKVVSRGIS